jgi:hypothetical protein
MAINVLNSQGTKIYLVKPPTTPWATCGEAITALKAGGTITCPQSLGEVAETRAVTEYKCLSSNESTKALGAISRSSFDIAVLLDPADKGGQLMLRDNFRNNTPLVMGIEYGGAMLYFNIGVSGVGTSIEQDAAITTKFSIEISSDIHECSTANLTSHPVVNNGIIVVNNGIPVVHTH